MTDSNNDLLRQAMVDAKERFRQQFGRDPLPNDPLIWDENADTPQPADPDQLEKKMLETLKEANIPPQLIYAYEKTGFILNEEAYKNLSDADRLEYDAAVEEYFDKNPE